MREEVRFFGARALTTGAAVTTLMDEFARARSAFKWRQLIALSRVTASAYGYAAPAHKESCELLKG